MPEGLSASEIVRARKVCSRQVPSEFGKSSLIRSRIVRMGDDAGSCVKFVTTFVYERRQNVIHIHSSIDFDDTRSP